MAIIIPEHSVEIENIYERLSKKIMACNITNDIGGYFGVKLEFNSLDKKNFYLFKFSTSNETV